MIRIRKIKRLTGLFSVSDTDSIDLTKSGTIVSGDVRLSTDGPDAGNKAVAIDIRSGASKGLRAQVAIEDLQDAAWAAGIDSNSINFTYDDAANQAYWDLVLSGTAAGAGFIKVVMSILSSGLYGEIAQSSIDHGQVSGLTDDDHTQYLLLAGRSSGQVAIGGTGAGETLKLQSTSNGTKGKVLFGAAGTSAYDEVNDRLGIGVASPLVGLDTAYGFALRQTVVATAGTLSDQASISGHLLMTGASAIDSLQDPANGKHMWLINGNTTPIKVVNNSGGTAANRILTGTGTDVWIAPGQSVLVIYDSTASRWRVQGLNPGLLPATAQTVASAGTITCGGGIRQLLRVAGNGGAQTVNATTGMTDGTVDGQEVDLMGTSDTNTLTIAVSGNMAPNGSITLGNGDIIRFIWDASNSVWREAYRSE